MADQSSKSGVFAVLGAALTVAFYGLANSGPPAVGQGAGGPLAGATPDAAPPAARASSAISDKDAYKPFVGFWALADPERGREYVAALPEALFDPGKTRIEFLISTVPDPIDSRFGYRFDSIIDDVQMAIESQGWNLDHFWFPWMPSGQQPGKRVNLVPITDPPAAPGYAIRMEPGGAGGRPGLVIAGNSGQGKPGDRWSLLPKHQREPGVLLFRKPWADERDPGKRQQILALFVVGETPTTGIHKIPLSMTLDIIREIYLRRARAGEDRQPEFRIIGPQFSGSERSLSFVIGEWASSRKQDGGPERWPWTFRVRTGGASTINRGKFIEDCGPAERAKVTFDATVLPYEDVILGLLSYLRKLNGGWDLGRIALLTESDTVYGSNAASPRFRDHENNYDVTEMKFPFHISQVAIAYDQHRRADDRSTPALARPSNKLKIPFDETGTPRDVVPSLSPGMTSATDEFVMARILDTISKEHYRYVGIIATDTRDIIFLAGLVRDYCPDVQLFVPTGDLLLGHPEYASQLQGTIVASTYPLFSMAQRWDPPHSGDRRRHLFSHESDQGGYNATVSLLAEGTESRKPFFDKMFDYGRPFDEFEDISLFYADRWGKAGKGRGVAGRTRREQEWRSEPEEPRPGEAGKPWTLPSRIQAEEPALWFGVVGQKGLWPVGFDEKFEGSKNRDYIHQEFIDTGDVDPDAFARQFLPLIPQFTWQWGTVFLVLTAGVAGVIAGLMGHGPQIGAIAGLSALIRPLDAQAPRGLRRQHEWGVFLALAILLGAYVHFAVGPCWIALWDSAWRVFAHRAPRGQMSWSDLQNWCFGLVAIYLSQVAAVALAGAVFVQFLRATGAFSANPPRPGPGWWATARTPLTWFAFLSMGGVLVLVESFWPCHDHEPGGGGDRNLFYPLLYFERAVNLGNGVSPLMPALILALAATAWLACQLKRVSLYRRLRTPIPEPTSEGFLPLIERDHEIDRLLGVLLPGRFARNPACLLGFLVASIAILRLLLSFVPTVDGFAFNLVMMGSIGLLMIAVVTSYCRFLLLWGQTKEVLSELASLTHLLPAFDRIPRQYSRLLGRYLDAVRPRLSDLAIPVEKWCSVAVVRDEIQAHAREHHVASGRLTEDRLRNYLDRIRPEAEAGEPGAAIHDCFIEDLGREHREGTAVALSPTRTGLRGAATACLELLALDWRATPTDPVPAGPTWYASGQEPGDAGASPPDGWKRRAEDLVALECVAYVSECAAHLRNLATLLGLVPVLLLLTVMVYPFQPQRFLILALGSLLLAVVAGVIYVYVQIDRDEILSRVSGTTPNRVDIDRTFLTNILTFLVPLIGLIVAQFPSFSDTLNQWVGPLFRSLK